MPVDRLVGRKILGEQKSISIYEKERGNLMFIGFAHASIALAYLFTVLITIISVAYGLRRWNSEGEISPEELEEESRWAAAEADLERDLVQGGAE